ncbi:YkvA family protein [Paenibacillus sp. DYY-L-2]|uniref:YkvA family protein n=1 Tax=Paenibacillus sp. DYY-L-2 TaxID=3447013 RepID=UPI003F500A9D
MEQTKRLEKLKKKAREIKQNVFILYLAYKHPQLPWYAKLVSVLVVAYAFSPVDLIPDFIPVLGYLDDIIIVPLGITLALKMIPRSIIEECREQAEEIRKNGKPKNWIMGALFILIWVIVLIWFSYLFYKLFV